MVDGLAFFKLFLLTWLTFRVPGRMMWLRYSTVAPKKLQFLTLSVTQAALQGSEDFVNVGDMVLDGVGIYNNFVKIYQTNVPVESG